MAALPGVSIASVEVVRVEPDPAVDFILARAVGQVDAQVETFLYRLPVHDLRPLSGSGRSMLTPPRTDGQPMLVLLHGPCVDTAASFGGLWRTQPALVQRLFEGYRGHVYAFEHPTLRSGVLGNALALAQTLPEGARLHLAGHSRGGLVAEALARACARPSLDDGDLALFHGPEHALQRRELQALTDLLHARRITVERVVRVASPVLGTWMAAQRLDVYLSLLRWCLQRAGAPAGQPLLECLVEAARRRADPARLPGLADQLPTSPLVRWLNRDGAAPGDLRVVAGAAVGDAMSAWLNVLASATVHPLDTDLLVETSSMLGGMRRSGGARFVLDQGAEVAHFQYLGRELMARAFVDALLLDDPPGFRPIGPLSRAGQSADGLR